MKTKHMDYTLLIVTIMLVAFGLLMVFSSSYYYAIDRFQDKFYFFMPELKWSIVGIGAMFVASLFDYRKYKHIAFALFGINVVFLILVLFSDPINNARRWIQLGSFSFQPVEITKISTIILVAYLLERNYKKINRPKDLLPYIGIAVFNAGFIMKQPNMSSAMIIVGIVATMIFVAGLNWFYVLFFGGAGGALAMIFIKSSEYRYERFLAFRNPLTATNVDTWQIVQSLYALGSGGIFGVGLGMSTQNKLYIPEPQNDFILATIGEEFGFIGTVVLLGLFLILIYRCIKIALNAPDYFSMFLASGITSMLALQVLMNYAVATSSMPVTGVSLPFISYGGTSIMTLLGAVGIMLNISKHCYERSSKGETE